MNATLTGLDLEIVEENVRPLVAVGVMNDAAIRSRVLTELAAAGFEFTRGEIDRVIRDLRYAAAQS